MNIAINSLGFIAMNGDYNDGRVDNRTIMATIRGNYINNNVMCIIIVKS